MRKGDNIMKKFKSKKILFILPVLAVLALILKGAKK